MAKSTQIKYIYDGYYLVTLNELNHLAPGSIIRPARKDEVIALGQELQESL